MDENKIIVNENGFVITPNVHDGLLVGIMLLSKKYGQIIAKDSHGAIFCIDLVGVVAIRAEDFREGNIILDLTLRIGDRVQKSEVASALGIENNSNYDEYLLKTMQRFQEKELVFVQLAPSYGCEITCICSHVCLNPAAAALYKKAIISDDLGQMGD